METEGLLCVVHSPCLPGARVEEKGPGGRIAGQLAHRVRPETESWRVEETLGLGPRDLGKYI